MERLLNGFYTASPVIQMGVIIFALLTIASVVIRLMAQLKPNQDFKELFQRIRSWWIMASFFWLSMAIHPQASILLFAFMSFLALKEYFTLIHTRIEDHRVLFWAFLAVPIQYWWVHIHWKAVFLIFMPVYMFLFIPARLLITGKTQGIVESMAKIHWGLMAFVFCLSHLAFLMTMPAIPAIPGGGKALVLYLVFLTEINDVAQYIWGKLFGRRPIAPTISPKKTCAGFYGGVITTTLVALLLRFLTGFSLEMAFFSGLIISLSGFLGDLVISAIKRDVGVKDSSQLIPGHGGILDRIDSLTYTAPLFFHFVSYLFYPAPH
ncbi:MAG TPA: phosphatidate cytidylyltransferase [Coleofasciculaceae cyanobacterium]